MDEAHLFSHPTTAALLRLHDDYSPRASVPEDQVRRHKCEAFMANCHICIFYGSTDVSHAFLLNKRQGSDRSVGPVSNEAVQQNYNNKTTT